MPNHITNRLTVMGDNPDKLLKKIANEEKQQKIDFNNIVQMPAVLSVEDSDSRLVDMARFFNGDISLREIMLGQQSQNPLTHLQNSNMARMVCETKLVGDLSDSEFERLVSYMRALRDTGYCDWFDWSRDKWGTKWNAYDQRQVDDITIEFDTAWSTPAPIWDQLSKDFPDNILHVQWADEDFGNNVGDMKVMAGNVLEGGALANGSPEAYKLAVDLKYGGELPDEMRWKDDGTVEYIDD